MSPILPPVSPAFDFTSVLKAKVKALKQSGREIMRFRCPIKLGKFEFQENNGIYGLDCDV
jgi:hypothetical protein